MAGSELSFDAESTHGVNASGPKPFSTPLHVPGAARHADGERFQRVGEEYLAGEAGRAGDVEGEVEEVVFLLAGRRQAGEILRGDDDVAGRAGHLPFARPFERLTGGPGDVEQALPGGGVDLAHRSAVGGDEADPGHAAKLSWRPAAASMRASAR